VAGASYDGLASTPAISTPQPLDRYIAIKFDVTTQWNPMGRSKSYQMRRSPISP